MGHPLIAGMSEANRRERPAVVVLIDDDAGFRESLENLLRSVGLEVDAFPSIPAFLGRKDAVRPGCLVLDVRLPGKSGLEYLDELAKAGRRPPIVFISGYADVPMSVRAMKAGAREFFTKPVHPQDLLDAIQAALRDDHERQSHDRRLAEIEARFETLSTREREVIRHLTAGRSNKQIAGDMGLSATTVKLHRSQIMRKMHAATLAELVKIASGLVESLTADRRD